ncbi:hypothetical protein ACFE04_011644 [Oxalis oulophora]
MLSMMFGKSWIRSETFMTKFEVVHGLEPQETAEGCYRYWYWWQLFGFSGHGFCQRTPTMIYYWHPHVLLFCSAALVFGFHLKQSRVCDASETQEEPVLLHYLSQLKCLLAAAIVGGLVTLGVYLNTKTSEQPHAVGLGQVGGLVTLGVYLNTKTSEQPHAVGLGQVGGLVTLGVYLNTKTSEQPHAVGLGQVGGLVTLGVYLNTKTSEQPLTVGLGQVGGLVTLGVYLNTKTSE